MSYSRRVCFPGGKGAMQGHPAFRVPKPGSLRFLVSEGAGVNHVSAGDAGVPLES